MSFQGKLLQNVCLLIFFLMSVEVKHPNIIIIFVDDMGWNDAGFHGLTEIPTPNIDALAYNGVILNNYYVASVCSPSRAALMSGRLPTSTGLQHFAIIDSQDAGLSRDFKILPQMLNDQGYDSHMVGKWHLGFSSKTYTPTSRGFRSHYGFWPAACDLYCHNHDEPLPRAFFSNVPCNDTRQTILFNGFCLRDGLKPEFRRDKYMTDLFTDRAKNIILNHKTEKPLFLFLAHHGVHRGTMSGCYRAPEKLTRLFTNIEKGSDRQTFAGSLTAIDRSLGEVVEALERKNMLKDTLILFSTDNGAPRPETDWANGGSNYPLRGGKQTVWEGGIRAAAFLWYGQWKMEPLVYNGLMHIADVMPTLYDIAGGRENITKDYGLDGLNMWPSIQNNLPSPRSSLLLQSDPIQNVTAYRSGDFKIIGGQTLRCVDNDDKYSYSGRGPAPPGVPVRCSKVETVLKKTFGRNVSVDGTPIKLNCGDTPAGTDDCDPVKEICLFNITEDPCEQRNLAKKMPEMVKHLQLEMSEKFVMAPNFPISDYNSNPVYWKNVWTNWKDYNVPYNGSTCRYLLCCINQKHQICFVKE